MGKETPSHKTSVVFTCWRIPTNFVSGRTQQPSTEAVVINASVPSYFSVEGQVNGLGTVHLLTLNVFSAWFLPIEKRKSSSSIKDGLQEKSSEITVAVVVLGFLFLCVMFQIVFAFV